MTDLKRLKLTVRAAEDQSTTQGKARTIDLASLTFYSGPLVPLSGDLWPTFDVVEAFAYGSDPHLAPTIVAKSLAPADNTTSAKLQTPPPQKSPRRAQPPNPQSSSTTRKNSLKSSNASPRNKRIPRPRNAFIIYRSTVWAQRKIPIGIERDHRHISRIIGHCWNSLPEEEKRTWKVRAEEEKREHLRKYPGYRYSPNTRTKKPVKRKVNRNGEKDKQRCKKVAELLLLGAEGSALENAVKELDVGNEGHSSIPAPSPTPSQSPITPLFSSRPLYHGEVQGTPKFLPEKNRSHEFPTFSLSMLTPPEVSFEFQRERQLTLTLLTSGHNTPPHNSHQFWRQFPIPVSDASIQPTIPWRARLPCLSRDESDVSRW